MRWPLRYQILFPFAGALLAVVLTISVLEAYLAAQRTQGQIEQQIRQVAQTLLEANFPLTDSVLRQTRGLSGAEFVLTDADGMLLASSVDDFDRGEIRDILVEVAQPKANYTLGDPVVLGAAEYFHTAITVGPRGTQDAANRLHILYPRSVLQRARWAAAYPPLVVGGILLVVVAVLATVIASRLSRPILELRRQLGRLVEGNFEPVPLPKRNDELRDLIGSVNLLGDQLEESRRAIERSERLSLLGQLSGGLAHQLRNSVAGARIAVQLHKRRCNAGEQDTLAVALRQLTLTESHLQRFLTVGQPTAPRLAQCDLAQVIEDVAQLLRPSCKHHNVDLRVDPDRGPAHLLADAEQLRQLLINLVLNGSEAAGSGGWVRIALAATDGAWVLRVTDSGRGPDRELLDRLFEPFATGKPEGIGLGLTVARRIAESHGGTIRLDEAAPTCFEVVLPSAQPEAVPGPSALAPAVAGAHSSETT